MKVKGEIHINKAIVHILNKELDVPKLSDFDLEINDQLSELITIHIKKSTKHDSRMFARFEDGSAIYDGCKKILTKLDDFIEKSKNISRRLFMSMKSASTPSANLLIVHYNIEDESAIAILKLNFNENFSTIEKVEAGKTKIEVKVDSTGFNKNQKLQKCAFIYDDIINDKNSSIIVLDKQSRSDSVSHYFLDSFLECKLINDDNRNTKNMIKEVADFINERYKDQHHTKIEKHRILSNFFEENNTFELDDMLNKLFNDDDTKRELKDRIADKEIDYTFTIDKLRARKLLTDKTLTTENGICIKGKAALFDDNTIEVLPEEDNDEYSQIVIHKVKNFNLA